MFQYDYTGVLSGKIHIISGVWHGTEAVIVSPFLKFPKSE
jgi:hypothetical protein